MHQNKQQQRKMGDDAPQQAIVVQSGR